MCHANSLYKMDLSGIQKKALCFQTTIVGEGTKKRKGKGKEEDKYPQLGFLNCQEKKITNKRDPILKITNNTLGNSLRL